jgi:hypothetical protein
MKLYFYVFLIQRVFNASKRLKYDIKCEIYNTVIRKILLFNHGRQTPEFIPASISVRLIKDFL